MKSIYMYFDLVDVNIQSLTDSTHLNFYYFKTKQNNSRLKRRYYEKT
jgi:hypothetical protein